MRARTASRRRHRAGPGSCTGSAARERRRAAESASAAAASSTCSQLSRITSAGAALEPLEQRRLAAGDVQRRDQRVDDFVGRRRGFEPRQPDATALAARSTRAPVGRLRSRAPSFRCRPVRRSRRAAWRRAGRRARRAPTVASDEVDRQSTAGSLPTTARVARRDVRSRRRATRRGPGSAARAVGAAVRGRGRARRPAACRTRWYVAERVGLAPGPVQRGDQQLPQRLPGTGTSPTAASSSPITSPASPSRRRAENWVSTSVDPGLFEPGPVRA